MAWGGVQSKKNDLFVPRACVRAPSQSRARSEKMPVVHVIDQRKGHRRLMDLVFPIRTSKDAQVVERWRWPELRVGASFIQGFGLFPQSHANFDWRNRPRPVAMPYLGKETEVESGVQARVLRTVLCGCFDVIRRKDLSTPPGHEWVQDGLYVMCVKTAERKRLNLDVIDQPDDKLLQVSVEPEVKAVSYIEEGDAQVCYLVYEETRELLHLPPHIFELLCKHADDEHADRNMATHVVQFSRPQSDGPPLHLLVSAHPVFRNSAYIMGNVNEPPRGAPSLELLELRLQIAPDDDPLMVRSGLKQNALCLAQLQHFTREHPEVLDKSTFFCSRKSNFCDAEELSVVYGASYKRTYNTWGHAGKRPVGSGTWYTWYVVVHGRLV